MEAKATNKYIGTSPRKMRLIIDLIRGKSVEEAIDILHFNTKHASKDAEKVLRSAVANLYNMSEDEKVDVSDLVVTEAYVNQGPTLKRMLPAPMGRAYRVRKRSNHLTVVVGTKS